MDRYRVFISYTMRRNDVDYRFLCNLKQALSSYDSIETYIDKLDNHASNHQEYVINTLCLSDVVLLLKTPNVNTSKWVQKELGIAIEYNIPIIGYDINTIQEGMTNLHGLDCVVSELVEAAKKRKHGITQLKSMAVTTMVDEYD